LIKRGWQQMINRIQKVIKQNFSWYLALVMSGLAIDLLYLYFADAWYDQIKAIEYIEVALLIWIVAFGIGYTIIKVRSFLQH
jgi:hypothetical protein